MSTSKHLEIEYGVVQIHVHVYENAAVGKKDSYSAGQAMVVIISLM
jgi:hypothetical protein